MELAYTADDIERIQRSGKIAALLVWRADISFKIVFL